MSHHLKICLFVCLFISRAVAYKQFMSSLDNYFHGCRATTNKGHLLVLTLLTQKNIHSIITSEVIVYDIL